MVDIQCQRAYEKGARGSGKIPVAQRRNMHGLFSRYGDTNLWKNDRSYGKCCISTSRFAVLKCDKVEMMEKERREGEEREEEEVSCVAYTQ